MIAKTIQIIRSSRFLQMNAILMAGSLVVAFLNYLYYPVLGRLLTTAQFGELQVIVSMFLQMTTFLTVLSLISVNILVSEKDRDKANKIVHELEKATLLFVIIISLAAIAVAEPLRQALKFDSPWPIVMVIIAFVISIPFTFRTAFLRARHDFVGTSLVNGLAALAKLGMSVVLVIIGWHVFGAAVGILLAQVLALLFATLRAKRRGYEKQRSARRPDWAIIKPYLRYSGLVLVVSLIITLQVSIDAAIVKYYFSPEQAGLYAGIATIARIVYFLTTATVIVLLSSISRLNPPQKNFAMLKKSFLIVVIAAGSATGIFSFFPTAILHLLLGARYDGLAHLLPLLSATMLVGSIANLLATYQIALHRYSTAWFVVTGAAVTYGWILLRHSQVDDIITALLIGSSVMAAGLTVKIISDQKRAVE